VGFWAKSCRKAEGFQGFGWVAKPGLVGFLNFGASLGNPSHPRNDEKLNPQ
tara:strand:- start:1137 stop:1289 length:153 start_codon:yes stop_codon:yes gene_type:complete